MKAIFTVAAWLMLSGAGAAQTIPESAQVPHGAMRKLDPLMGDWRAVTEMRGEDGTWAPQSVDLVRVSTSLNDLLMTETHVSRISGEGFTLKTDYTFDQYRDVYRVSVVDDGWGLMDIYEGRLAGGALTLTNLRIDTPFVLDDGQQMHFRLIVPVGGDERVMEIERTLDRGESWQPFYRVTYTRVEE